MAMRLAVRLAARQAVARAVISGGKAPACRGRGSPSRSAVERKYALGLEIDSPARALRSGLLVRSGRARTALAPPAARIAQGRAAAPAPPAPLTK